MTGCNVVFWKMLIANARYTMHVREISVAFLFYVSLVSYSYFRREAHIEIPCTY